MTEFLVICVLGLLALSGIILAISWVEAPRTPTKYLAQCPYCLEKWVSDDRDEVLERALTHSRWWHK